MRAEGALRGLTPVQASGMTSKEEILKLIRGRYVGANQVITERRLLSEEMGRPSS